jgi:hypothetical protein
MYPLAVAQIALISHQLFMMAIGLLQISSARRRQPEEANSPANFKVHV